MVGKEDVLLVCAFASSLAIAHLRLSLLLCSTFFWTRGLHEVLRSRDDFCRKAGVEDIHDAGIRVHIEAFDFEKVVARVIVIFDRPVTGYITPVMGCLVHTDNEGSWMLERT